MTRISEPDLILPALCILSSRNMATTSGLIVLLRDKLHPSGEDLEILAGRNDDKFSQKVRNLKSHKTLTKEGYAKEVKGRGDGQSVTAFAITDKGRRQLDGYVCS